MKIKDGQWKEVAIKKEAGAIAAMKTLSNLLMQDLIT